MSEACVLHQWVVYDHPRDFPEHFVVRHWLVTGGRRVELGPEVWLRPDLLGARLVVDSLCPEAVRLPRDQADDPTIVGVWM